MFGIILKCLSEVIDCAEEGQVRKGKRKVEREIERGKCKIMGSTMSVFNRL